jgi:hypothetical protein
MPTENSRPDFYELFRPWTGPSVTVGVLATLLSPVFLFLSVGCCDGPRDLADTFFFYPAKPLAWILQTLGVDNYLATLIAFGPSCGLLVLGIGLAITGLRYRLSSR